LGDIIVVDIAGHGGHDRYDICSYSRVSALIQETRHYPSNIESEYSYS